MNFKEGDCGQRISPAVVDVVELSLDSLITGYVTLPFMPDGKTRVNLIFGSAVAVLAATAVYFMYVNRDLPPIRQAPRAEFSPGSALPQDHPPIDGASRLALLEQMSRNDPGNADYRTQLGNLHYDNGKRC
jgi:hypothetical protein